MLTPVFSLLYNFLHFTSAILHSCWIYFFPDFNRKGSFFAGDLDPCLVQI